MAGSAHTLSGYSIFSPTYVTKVINDIVIDSQDFGVIDQYIPDRTQEPNYGTDIVWDEQVFLGGMTAPSDVNATSPIVSGEGARQRRWTPPHFREKTIITGDRLLNMCQLGTTNNMRKLATELNKDIARLRTRIDNRRYWLKWEAVQNNAAFNVIGNGMQISLDYSTVGIHPTAAPAWNGALPTILDDIIGFVSQFRATGFYPVEAMFGTPVLQTMLADTTIRTLLENQIYRNVQQRNIFNTTPGQAGLTAFLESIFAGIKFSYYPVGPIVTLVATLPNPGGGVASVVDGPIELFAVDDVVTMKQPDGTRSSVTLTAVSTTQKTITGAGAHAKGTVFYKRMEFMHRDQFVMMAKMPPGQIGGDVAAEWVYVGNFHGPGGIDKPVSGIVGKTINKENEDPPRIEVISSFSGGVVVYHTDGPWLSATVLS